jgi:hypothetical protein
MNALSRIHVTRHSGLRRLAAFGLHGLGSTTVPSLSKPQTGSCGSGSALTLSTISCSANKALHRSAPSVAPVCASVPSRPKSLQGARQRLTEGRFSYMLVKIKPGAGAG